MQSNHRPVYGFLLSLLTAFLWGILPVALILCLAVMDSPTITFYRFFTAACVVFTILFLSKKLPTKKSLSKSGWGLAIIATVMLVINYVTNVLSLRFLSASSAQVLMQVAPFLLMLGGVILYKETFTRIQTWGALCLITGLGLFFNQRLPQIFNSQTESALGILIVLGSAIAWASYALAQKRLLAHVNAQQLTLVLYVAGSLLLFPLTQLDTITTMSALQLTALIFCCLNTLIAYGAFTEAINVWYASKVSAVLATQPIFTYISMSIAENIMPQTFNQPNLDIIAYTGGAFVVVGSVLSALGKKR